MHYLFMYVWKMAYWISGIVIFVGMFILGADTSKIFIDSSFLQLLASIVIWIIGSSIVLKPLGLLDKRLESSVSLDADARLHFNMFATFVLISIAVFCASIYTFDMWLGLINDPNGTLDDFLTIIFPLVLVVASIASFIGSFKLYTKYREILSNTENVLK